jgi:hypothetical protein
MPAHLAAVAPSLRRSRLLSYLEAEGGVRGKRKGRVALTQWDPLARGRMLAHVAERRGSFFSLLCSLSTHYCARALMGKTRDVATTHERSTLPSPSISLVRQKSDKIHQHRFATRARQQADRSRAASEAKLSNFNPPAPHASRHLPPSCRTLRPPPARRDAHEVAGLGFPIQLPHCIPRSRRPLS